MDDNVREFALAYATLCRKHGLCIAPEAWEGTLIITNLEDGTWLEEVISSEGIAAFEPPPPIIRRQNGY